MYSVVLMAALTTAPTTQAWHRGCHACHGCNGGYAAANSCWYGCQGANWYSCFGCNGWYGNPWYGASGSFGYPTFQCHGCYGCYGGWSCYGSPVHQAVTEPAPPSKKPPVENLKPETKPGKGVEEAPLPKPKQPGSEQTRARVIIDLPADAKLYIDDNLMPTGPARRTFQTPDLIAGQTYFYDLRAEVVRDGQVIRATQKIILRPGQAATASFADLGQKTNATARAEE